MNETQTITAEQAMNENAKVENENTADFSITAKCSKCGEVDSFPSDSLSHGFDYDQNWIVGSTTKTELNDNCECGELEFFITEISYCGKTIKEGADEAQLSKDNVEKFLGVQCAYCYSTNVYGSNTRTVCFSCGDEQQYGEIS